MSRYVKVFLFVIEISKTPEVQTCHLIFNAIVGSEDKDTKVWSKKHQQLKGTRQDTQEINAHCS